MVFKAPPRHPGAKNSWAFHDQNPAKQERRGGRRKRGTRGRPAGFREGQSPIYAPSPLAPMAMAAFLTGQPQHQGCERGSSRPAVLDLHRSGGGSGRWRQQHGRRGGEYPRRGARERER